LAVFTYVISDDDALHHAHELITVRTFHLWRCLGIKLITHSRSAEASRDRMVNVLVQRGLIHFFVNHVLSPYRAHFTHLPSRSCARPAISCRSLPFSQRIDSRLGFLGTNTAFSGELPGVPGAGTAPAL